MPEGRARQTFGTIIVVGGGCYGSYYLRQLRRAIAAGAVEAREIVVVDRDPGCRVAGETDHPSAAATLAVREWTAFFDGYLRMAADEPAAAAGDAIVPSPLMPHLMGSWLAGRARERFAGRVTTRPFDAPPEVPWERAGADGTHYVSFATWMCPVNCVEPRTCPHIAGPRTWSMPDRVAEYAAATPGTASAVLFCRHRAYGVGMFDTREVLDADRLIRLAGERGKAEVIIGTVSHCHGALTRLVIAAPAETADSTVS